MFRTNSRKKSESKNLSLEFLKFAKCSCNGFAELTKISKIHNSGPKLAFLPVNQTANYTSNSHKFFARKNFLKCNGRILDLQPKL